MTLISKILFLWRIWVKPMKIQSRILVYTILFSYILLANLLADKSLGKVTYLGFRICKVKIIQDGGMAELPTAFGLGSFIASTTGQV